MEWWNNGIIAFHATICQYPQQFILTHPASSKPLKARGGGPSMRRQVGDMVKRVIEAHSGKIFFESGPGGTLFVIELPL
jgi:hypothetical protein